MAETTESAGEALAFLQRRVQWFGLLAGALVLGFYVYRSLDEASLAALAEPSMLTHAGAGLSLLGMWLALRGPTRAARWVRLVEISGLVLASTLIFGLRKQVGNIRALGQYHLEAEIGAGGMGIVYDYGRTPGGMFYYAMELLDGASLEQNVDSSGPLPVGRAVHVLRQAAGALCEAHELGLIHRDIKPANIMLCNQGGQMDVAKVLDFGLVKELQGASPALTRGLRRLS